MNAISTPNNKRRRIVVSSLAVILIMSIFVAAQGDPMPRSHSTANKTLPESVSKGTAQSTSTNDQGANMQLISPDIPKVSAAKSRLSQDSASGNLQSPSTNGPKIEQLRVEVVPATRPLPPPDEVLYLNEFNEWYYEWNNPAENAFGEPDGSYIESDTNAEYASLYGFEDIVLGDEEIGDIQIECYAQYPNGYSEDLDIDLYGFSSVADFVWLGSGWGTASWGWHEVRWIGESVLDVMPELANETELNNLELLIYNYHGDAPDIMRVDSVRLNIWYEQEPPEIQSPRVEAMLTGQIDALTDLLSPEDIETLDNACFTITQDPEFHMGFIGYNIRDLAATDRVPGGVGWKDTNVYNYRPDLIGEYWPLADVEFRHALIHCYNQLYIVPSIYGYTVISTRSLVPPAQARYYNPNVPEHPYNPGDPFTSPAGEHSTVGILKAAGYTFVDAGTIGSVDSADYWQCPGGNQMPRMVIYTPLMEVAPTSYQHGAEFVADLAGVGLAATTSNGDRGLINQGNDFNEYLNWCYGTSSTPGGLFDAYMVFYSLGRIPDHLYDLMHSSSETATNWAGRNAVGIIDPTIDTLTEVVRFSLNPDDIEVAAKQVQVELYDTINDYALAYMVLYSKSALNAFNSGLRGIVKSPGFGSKNMWTFLNMHWEQGHPYERIEDGMSTVVWCIGDEPQSFNPTSAFSANEWTILDRIYEALTVVNPYNHYDVPWIATDWAITPVGDGMNIDFTIRSDVEWQDGKPVTAYDIEWCLEFIRDRQIPRYYSCCAHITDVVVADNTHFTIQCDEAGISLFYDLSSLGVLLPRHIWDRPWVNNQEVLDYDPRETYDVASGYTPGPHPTPTNVMGTGPFVFQFYDSVNQYSDLWENPYYFKTEADIANQMTEMFWEVGDANRNGAVDQNDLDRCEFALGSTPGDPNWDPDCDFNNDDFIGLDDLNTVNYHIGWQLEYPAEVIDVAVLEIGPFPTVVYPGQEINISVIAKNKGNAGFTTNFTCYYNNTFIDSQTVTNLIPCHNTTMNFLWDTTSVSPGVYTISVNATVLDGTDANLTDNTFVSEVVKIGTTRISVDPQKSIVGSAGKGFSINITTTDAPYNATWAWEFRLSWNASLLDITDVSEGTFLSQGGMWATAFANFTNQAEGWVLVSCTLTDDPIEYGQPLPDGNATLATISFIALDLGNCTLHLSDTILLNYNIDPYYHTTQDGEFEVALGDINRDGIVDDEDIEIVQLAYGAVPGSPNWNPEADIWGPDGEPDGLINVYDLAMCGKKFG